MTRDHRGPDADRRLAARLNGIATRHARWHEPTEPAPAGELSRVLAADGSRCCLREWLARVPDPRSRLGRWHPLVFVLAVAVCAFRMVPWRRASGETGCRVIVNA